MWCVFFASGGSLVRAQNAAERQELEKTLATTASFTWTDRKLSDGLDSLGKAYGVQFWIDRRLNTERDINFATGDLSLRQSLRDLATSLNWHFAVVGPVLYFGPPASTPIIPAIVRVKQGEIEKLKPEPRRRWETKFATPWSDVVTPREMIESITRASGVACANIEVLEHDLRPRWQGPELATYQWLALVLAEHDATFELDDDGRTFRIVPLPAELVYEETYRTTVDLAALGKEIKRLFPDLKLKRVSAKEFSTVATGEQHAKIASLVTPPREQPVNKAGPEWQRRRFTLTAENQPRGAIVKTLATELKMEFRFPPELATKLQERVSVQVKDVTLEQLLDQVLKPAGLSANISPTTLEVVSP